MKKILIRRMSGAASLFLSGFFLIFTPSAQPESAEQLPKPTSYVSDFANVLSAQSVSELERACLELDHSNTNSQLVIVTVHSLDGMDAADYANQLENRWRVGRKGSDRGILLLLAVDDRKWRIDVGYGLEGILNDAKIGDIGRSMVPFLRAKQYDGAAMAAVRQLSQVIAADAKISLSQTPPPQRMPTPPVIVAFVKLLPFIFLILLVSVFALLSFLFSRGIIGSGHKARNSGGTTDDSDSGGSSSSSGSDSSSSSDSSACDGGSFGGGGAGGDW